MSGHRQRFKIPEPLMSISAVSSVTVLSGDWTLIFQRPVLSSQMVDVTVELKRTCSLRLYFVVVRRIYCQISGPET